MTNCKHGNGQDCLQCQYERDVASGYPEPWRLWEVSRYGAGFQGYCSSKENPLSETLTNTYRRRHDADEIIKEWERGQISNCSIVKDIHRKIMSEVKDAVTDHLDETCGAYCEIWNTLNKRIKHILDYELRSHAAQELDKCATCRHDYEKREG